MVGDWQHDGDSVGRFERIRIRSTDDDDGEDEMLVDAKNNRSTVVVVSLLLLCAVQEPGIGAFCTNSATTTVSSSTYTHTFLSLSLSISRLAVNLPVNGKLSQAAGHGWQFPSLCQPARQHARRHIHTHT